MLPLAAPDQQCLLDCYRIDGLPATELAVEQVDTAIRTCDEVAIRSLGESKDVVLREARVGLRPVRPGITAHEDAAELFVIDHTGVHDGGIGTIREHSGNLPMGKTAVGGRDRLRAV